MKKINGFFSVLLVLSLLFSAGAVAAELSSRGAPVGAFKIVVDEQADPAIVALENLTAKEVYLPSSYGYRAPAN